MGHRVYCFEVENARLLSQSVQMNNVICGTDEYLKGWRQSGDPESRGH